MMAEKVDHKSVWRKLLAGQDGPSPSAASVGPQLGYDLASLPEADVYQHDPRLSYDIEPLFNLPPTSKIQGGTAAVQGGSTAQTAAQPRGEVKAPFDGVVMRGMTGWQNPNAHHGKGSGMGWRTWLLLNDGSRVGYGHMEPSSTLPDGTQVKAGDVIGRYGDPTNGRSTGPHVHVQAYDKFGRLIKPPTADPFGGGGKRGRQFREQDAMHRGPQYKDGHQGDDWIQE
jgi:murein DD-endopeptidase MepM/ murein hydrolase activator NlpD